MSYEYVNAVPAYHGDYVVKYYDDIEVLVVIDRLKNLCESTWTTDRNPWLVLGFEFEGSMGGLYVNKYGEFELPRVVLEALDKTNG